MKISKYVSHCHRDDAARINNIVLLLHSKVKKDANMFTSRAAQTSMQRPVMASSPNPNRSLRKVMITLPARECASYQR